MGCIPSLLLLITMATMYVGAVGKFYRDTVHHSPDLTGDDVTVNVMSDIPGNLKWISTNQTYLTITVKVSATAFDVLNSTEIVFTSDNSSVFLDIRSSSLLEPAAVYSTGSRNSRFIGSPEGVIVLLLWAAVVVLDWRYIHAAMFVLLFQTFAGASLDTSDLSHFVDVVVHGPSHIRYKSLHLLMENGIIRIPDELFKHSPEVRSTNLNIPEVRCITDQSTKGCDGCCYGNGVCFNNTCLCDEGFDQIDMCKTFKQREILYISPLDPRLTKTILPDGRVFDLSTPSNNKDRVLHDKGRVHSKLRVRSMDSEFSDVVFHFEENGLIKRVRHKKSSFILRKKRNSNCNVDIVIKKGGVRRNSLTINVCNTPGYVNLVDITHADLGDDFKALRHHGRSLNIDRVSKKLRARRNVREIPVVYKRCGHETQRDVGIYFKVNQESENTGNYLRHFTDDIVLHTTFTRHRHQLTIPVRNVSDKDVQNKCERAIEMQSNICKPDYLTLYSFVCDSITILDRQNETEFGTKNGVSSEAVNMCYFLAGTLKDYCASIIFNDTVLTRDSSCLSRYHEKTDLFSTDQLTLSPSIVLPNGETVAKKDIVIDLQNISYTFGLNEIVLTEEFPEFKIVNIAVIPKDPVPQDIYKVRMDYACATNQTVINMNVTGSDKYSSHVTCQGVTECNCCVVHAAGAADAVIDYVTINITDPLANTQIYREMMVIF